MKSVAYYEARLPSIPWRLPVTVVVEGEYYRLCRICIAEGGLKGDEVAARAFPTIEEHRRHLDEVHEARVHEGHRGSRA